jgi:dynein heavy chain
MSDDYKFSPSGRYTSIPTGTKTHYLQYISEMPINPDPEVFGMHENADMTSAQQQTDLLFETILKMQPRSSGGAGKSREEILAETAKSILEKVPQEWDVETIGKKYPTLYSESMNTVLVQEAVRYNKLLFTIISTLENFLKALKGEMVMTLALEAMATSMFNNTVPTAWDDVAYPSLMPLAEWVNDLLARIAFINQWIDEGVPKVFWISGFFFPQAFLTGSLQNYARKTTKPIDAISFTFHVLDRKLEELTEPPRDGIYIRGLFLQGCRWDAARHSLVESRPKELFVSFPVMWLQPEFEKKDVVEGYYKCPVYKILTRAGVLMTTGHSTNFVLYAMLPTTVHERVWIKAGVALFCALRY